MLFRSRILRRLTFCLALSFIATSGLIAYNIHNKYLYYNWKNNIDYDDDYISANLAEIPPDFKKLDSYNSMSSIKDAPFFEGCTIPDINQRRANATFVVLARNSEVGEVVLSMKSMERHFNQWFNYPWVFLNDEPFDENFINTVSKHTKSQVEFGVIPQEDWNFNKNVDPDEIHEYIENQGDRTVLYGNMESYHKMCRFYSGAFYKHELVKKRDWYWRVEPNVEFFCDLTYDPFIELEKHNKKYGFTIMINEIYFTVPSLFRETLKFIKKNKIKVGKAWDLFIRNSEIAVGDSAQPYNTLDRDKLQILEALEHDIIMEEFINKENKQNKDFEEINKAHLHKFVKMASEKPKLYEDRIDNQEYNLGHFWTNFEIARTDLFNSPTYEAYFKHLDESGGFYKERWGDAPVHSLGLVMMLDLEELHYFRDIGYRHSTIMHCPKNAPKSQLQYNPSESYDQSDVKFEKYWLTFDRPFKYGVGCRCKCPRNHREVEDSGSTCLSRWKELTSDSYKGFVTIDINQWRTKIRKRLKLFLKQGGKLGEKSLL